MQLSGGGLLRVLNVLFGGPWKCEQRVAHAYPVRVWMALRSRLCRASFVRAFDGQRELFTALKIEIDGPVPRNFHSFQCSKTVTLV